MSINITEIPVILSEITVDINNQSEQDDIYGALLTDINDCHSDIVMSETGPDLEIAPWLVCSYIAAPRHRTDGVIVSLSNGKD